MQDKIMQTYFHKIAGVAMVMQMRLKHQKTTPKL